jgi:hypothetical protein
MERGRVRMLREHGGWGWRGVVAVVIAGLWLAVGVVWGPGAAVDFGFPVFVGCVVGVWVVVAGRLARRAGAGYYARQLEPRETGRWRDRVTHHRT